MSGWHWFSESGLASAFAYLTRRDGLCADLSVGDVDVSMQVAPPRNLSVGLKFDINDDEPVTGHVGVWPLPMVYLSADAPILQRLARALAGDTGREIRAWFGPDESVDHLSAHWSLWTDPCEYVCDTPRWRHGSVSPLAVLNRKRAALEPPLALAGTVKASRFVPATSARSMRPKEGAGSVVAVTMASWVAFATITRSTGSESSAVRRRVEARSRRRTTRA